MGGRRAGSLRSRRETEGKLASCKGRRKQRLSLRTSFGPVLALRQETRYAIIEVDTMASESLFTLWVRKEGLALRLKRPTQPRRKASHETTAYQLMSSLVPLQDLWIPVDEIDIDDV
jgi:hypothetical protein